MKAGKISLKTGAKIAKLPQAKKAAALEKALAPKPMRGKKDKPTPPPSPLPKRSRRSSSVRRTRTAAPIRWISPTACSVTTSAWPPSWRQPTPTTKGPRR